MGKPLLTDEIIEKARRGEKITGSPLSDEEETKILFAQDSAQFGYQSPHSQEEILPPLEDTLQIEIEPTVIKSRRIENEKRSVFQSKLNKVLLVIIILLALLILAIFRL